MPPRYMIERGSAGHFGGPLCLMIDGVRSSGTPLSMGGRRVGSSRGIMETSRIEVGLGRGWYLNFSGMVRFIQAL